MKKFQNIGLNMAAMEKRIQKLVIFFAIERVCLVFKAGLPRAHGRIGKNLQNVLNLNPQFESLELHRVITL